MTTYKIVTIRLDADADGQACTVRGPKLEGQGTGAGGLDSGSKLPGEGNRASDSALNSKGHHPAPSPLHTTPTQISAPRLQVPTTPSFSAAFPSASPLPSCSCEPLGVTASRL